MNHSTKAIETQNVRKEFGVLTAVKDVSFSVDRGEFFGLLGPNGAGKSTMIRMMYGFSPLTGGRILVFGLDITEDGVKIRSQLGVCQQENTLDPDLSVEQNLLICGRYFGLGKSVARKRTDEWLTFNIAYLVLFTLIFFMSLFG